MILLKKYDYHQTTFLLLQQLYRKHFGI